MQAHELAVPPLCIHLLVRKNVHLVQGSQVGAAGVAELVSVSAEAQAIDMEDVVFSNKVVQLLRVHVRTGDDGRSNKRYNSEVRRVERQRVTSRALNKLGQLIAPHHERPPWRASNETLSRISGYDRRN